MIQKLTILPFSTVLFLLLILAACQPKEADAPLPFSQQIVIQDVANFWTAYDSIQTTTDSLTQIAHLQRHFLDPASVGQLRMIEERNYTLEEYRQSIISKPAFWNSLRPNTENFTAYNAELREGVRLLYAIYPALRPSTIYFTFGAHRSSGTGTDSLVLIGTEYALGDSTLNTNELNPYRQNYYQMHPVDHLQLLTIHEYVHTQQREMEHNLLALTLYEGIAEFVAQQATGKLPPYPAFIYGPKNDDRIRQQFEKDIFLPDHLYDWLWNAPDNQFSTADLSYYVGHRIATLYYEQAEDQAAALQTLIEIDYSDEDFIEAFVDGTGYLSAPLAQLYEDFVVNRPSVVRVEGIENGGTEIDPETTHITLHFSDPIDPATRGFDYGPLGEDHVLRVQEVIGFSEDNRAFTFTVNLDPGRRYQSRISQRFLGEDGMPLKPLLIDFTTASRR